MLRRLLDVTFVVSLAACAVPPPAPAAPPVPNLAEKLAMDEQRINDGWRLGQFTPPEYHELQGRHAAIEHDRRERLEAGGGPPGQYEQLVAREEALSRTIYDYRHNGATPTAH